MTSTFAARPAPIVADLDNALTRARSRAAGLGVIRVGILNAASGSLVLNEAVERFEAEHEGASVQDPGCDAFVTIVEQIVSTRQQPALERRQASVRTDRSRLDFKST